jgi:hypothetical protein
MTQSCCATFWFIVACGGAGSGAPWQLWEDGGRHGQWVRGLASFTYDTLGVSINILSMRIPGILLVQTSTKPLRPALWTKKSAMIKSYGYLYLHEKDTSTKNGKCNEIGKHI